MAGLKLKFPLVSVVVEAVAAPVRLIITPEKADPLAVTVPDILYVVVETAVSAKFVTVTSAPFTLTVAFVGLNV